MCHCVLGKIITGTSSCLPLTITYFPLGPSSIPIVVAQPDERLANRNQKSALRWCGLTNAECLVSGFYMNKRVYTVGYWLPTIL